eukprot:16439495-Heterocapsa_arctica.AAC.1
MAHVTEEQEPEPFFTITKYENIDDAERVHEAAELIAERGGLQALKANFYVILWALEHIAPDE